MVINSIRDGIVLDHIQAGRSMEIYTLLGLDRLDCSVAIIKNVRSNKLGRKDIIKIDQEMNVNLDVLGYIDPGITVNIIKDGKRIQKCRPDLPEKLTNVLLCKNPRCITTTEQELPHIFRLSDRDKHIYRCIYCDAEGKNTN